ncbi:hypothetical protein BO79DRAFT_224016 [Aspergillus costaricaensis CBS 115574]|uniref:Uncharacterized protein n=1 Tax=Aspergillus costaricaensis CBS 115574 TaxID=1448317 RepID=A0ACD1ITW1_9EURO|nr:hypothetical protein BO79DRAFT_224016 [Aspergillus costaricaensis CBS 115574]RAK93548.1 hypothetical protein BO79DRAFT_224016 [Aspergillus costaricaensis CBS 115574]
MCSSYTKNWRCGLNRRMRGTGRGTLPVLEGLISDEVLLESQRMDRPTEPHLCLRKEHRTNGGKLRNEAKTKRIMEVKKEEWQAQLYCQTLHLSCKRPITTAICPTKGRRERKSGDGRDKIHTSVVHPSLSRLTVELELRGMEPEAGRAPSTYLNSSPANFLPIYQQ